MGESIVVIMFLLAIILPMPGLCDGACCGKDVEIAEPQQGQHQPNQAIPAASGKIFQRSMDRDVLCFLNSCFGIAIFLSTTARHTWIILAVV